MTSVRNIGAAILTVVLFASFSPAEQYNGGYGLQYVTAAKVLPAGSWMVTDHSRIYAWRESDYTESVASAATSLNFGIGHNLELEVTGILYQDLLNAPDMVTANYPDDIYFRWKWTPFTIKLSPTVPIEFGLQGSARLQNGLSYNVPLEPYYDSGGNTAQLTALFSYFSNRRFPTEGFQVHANIGYVNFNDAVDPGEATRAIQYYLGSRIPLSGLSLSLINFDYLLEAHGTSYLGYSEFKDGIYSIEDYLYLTSSLQWRALKVLTLTSGVDVLVYQGDNLTTRYTDFIDYPSWRATFKLTFMLPVETGWLEQKKADDWSSEWNYRNYYDTRWLNRVTGDLDASFMREIRAEANMFREMASQLPPPPTKPAKPDKEKATKLEPPAPSTPAPPATVTEPAPAVPAEAVEIEETPAQPVEEIPAEFSVGVLKAVTFISGKAEFADKSAEAELEKIARAMDEYPAIRIRVIGYTDITGNADLNLRLSRERADAVKDFLVAQGISPDRIEAVGMGATNFINPDNPSAAENRRTELEIVR